MREHDTEREAQTGTVNTICKCCMICGEPIPMRLSYDYNPEVCSECKEAVITLKKALDTIKFPNGKCAVRST